VWTTVTQALSEHVLNSGLPPPLIVTLAEHDAVVTGTMLLVYSVLRLSTFLLGKAKFANTLQLDPLL
jgi:hypothetical protein